MTLTEFLLARIAEDEAVARHVIATPDRLNAVGFTPWIEGDWLLLPHTPVVGITPARVLAECEAKRRIVTETAAWFLARPAGASAPAMEEMMRRPLLHLAIPYADHPDYRQEWKP